MAAVLENEVFRRRSELVRRSPPDLSLLARYETKWTPMELLKEDRQGISKEASPLSDDLVVAVFYHGATEGALPSYLARLQMYDATKDFSGTDESQWAVWDRGWTAEEHDHDLVHRDYLRLSGRVRLDLYDRATADLIRRGFNTGVDDPLELICYTIWQELTTAAVHNNTADLALKQGAHILSKALKIVQGDERRHAMAYMSVTDQILELGSGPDELVIAFYNLLKMRPEMPTKNMTLFREYVEVVAYNGLSAASTLVDIEEKMIDRFKIRTLHGLSTEAEEARDKLLTLHEKNAKRAAVLDERRLEGRVKKPDLSQFDWLIPQEAA